jgi:phage gp29-like protein
LDIAESKDIGMFAEALPKLAKVGMRIKRSWAHAELGIPEADDEKDLLVVTEETPAGAPAGRQAAATAKIRQPAAPRDREDQLAELLADSADPIVKEWVDQIRALIDGAGSLEEVRDGLLPLLADVDAEKFAKVMQHALAIAGAAGMLDALEDSRA